MHTTALPQLALPSIFQAIAESWRRWRIAAQRRRDAHANYLMLHSLDAHTLRDLGFDRSELMSVAAEIAGDADTSRARARPHSRFLSC